MSVSLVIFVGVACSNKTSYYQKNLSNHERVSLVEWKQEDEELSPHAMFKRIIAKLNNNTSVVIDDDNLTRKTRASLISKVKSGVKNVQVKCILFKNPGGVRQCLWQNEIKIAEKFEKEERKYCLNADRADKESKEIEVPQKEEGYDEIITVESKLTVHGASIDFNNQALFVDCSSMYYMNEDSYTLKENVEWLFDAWMKEKPNGRIILLCIPRRMRAMSISVPPPFTPRNYPVYYLYPMNTQRYAPYNQFWEQDGMVAFSLCTFGLNLDECVLVSDAIDSPTVRESHLDLADSCGLIHIKFPTKQSALSTIVAFGNDQRKKRPKWMDVTFEDNGEKHNRWPLLAELDDEQKEVDATLKRFVGVFCQKSNITKYKQLDKDTVNLSQESRKLEEYKQFRMEEKKSSQNTVKKEESNSQPTPASQTEEYPATDMTKSYIVEFFGLTNYQRGLQYEDEGRVSAFRFKVVPNAIPHFKVYSVCQGEESYKQEALFKKGKISKAICTCPVGKEGKCKHVCACVLGYIDLSSGKKPIAKKEEPSETKTTTKAESPVEEKFEDKRGEKRPREVKAEVQEEDEDEPQDVVKKTRKLPEWMETGKISEPKKRVPKSDKPSAKEVKDTGLKRPKTSYFLFCDDFRQQVTNELGGNSVTAVAKVLGERWKSLDQAEKDKYTERYHVALEEYNKQVKERMANKEETNDNENGEEEEKPKKKKQLKPMKEKPRKKGAKFIEEEFSSDESEPEPPKKVQKKTTASVKKEPVAPLPDFDDDDDDDNDSATELFFSKSAPKTTPKPSKTGPPAVDIPKTKTPVKKEVTPSSPRTKESIKTRPVPTGLSDSDEEDAASIFFAKKKPQPQQPTETIRAPRSEKPKPAPLPSPVKPVKRPVKKTESSPEEDEPIVRKRPPNISQSIASQAPSNFVLSQTQDDEDSINSVFFGKKKNQRIREVVEEKKPSKRIREVVEDATEKKEEPKTKKVSLANLMKGAGFNIKK